MEQVRRILATIQMHLGRLTATQKLLIGSLMVLALMSLFIVSLYAGRSELAELLPGATAEDRAQAVAYLRTVGINAIEREGKVLVPAEAKYAALAQLQQGRKMPADTRLLFANLAEKQHWMMPRSQMEQLASQALMNELALVISNFPGIESASVFVSNPEPRGLGAAARKPTANVTVHTRPGVYLTTEMVNSLADLVSGSVAGLEAGEVRIIDSAKGKRYRAQDVGDVSASEYLEQVIKIEQRIQDKLMDALRYIDGVIVTVNAQVDGSRRETKTHRVLPKGEGTESLIARETTSTVTQGQASAAYEPGVRPNTSMDLGSPGGGGGVSLSEEQTETAFENAFGTQTDLTIDPRGRPTRINATVSVPRNWAEGLARQRKGAAGGEPTEEEVQAAWAIEQERLRSALQPLVEATLGDARSEGTVVVSMIPVAVPGLGAPVEAAAGGVAGIFGGGGVVGGMIRSGAIKTVVLGALAAASLLMMGMMVLKAGKREPLPSAEELTGIPPPLDPGMDVIGEAGEGDTAMTGIEIDDTALRSKKMLEQVSELVKKNPDQAASLFNRWISTES